jgi:hypothetical protein
MVLNCPHCNKEYASQSSRSNHIKKFHSDKKEKNEEKIEIKKFICDKCNKNFTSLDDISNHSKNDCRPSIKSNNVYKFKTDTFGKNKYKDFKGGDIYIIQTEFNLKGFYKIGVSTDLYKRIGQYRCGAVLEPKLHYYYPCKNIKETDKYLKAKLKKFNVKREIYTTENIDELRNAIKEVQKKSGSVELEVIPENKECDIIPCDFCDLYFTNKQDLIIHCENNHKEEYNDDNLDIEIDETLFKNNICKKCNKSFADRICRWRHEKKCKNNTELIKKNLLEIKKKEEIREKEMLEMKKEITELKIIINKLQKSKQIYITD